MTVDAAAQKAAFTKLAALTSSPTMRAQYQALADSIIIDAPTPPPPAPTLPAPPVMLTPTIAGGGPLYTVTVPFTPTPDPTVGGYCLIRDGIKVDTRLGNTPRVDTNVAAGQHTYTMCAYNGLGDGPLTAPITLNVGAPVPSPAPAPAPVPPITPPVTPPGGQRQSWEGIFAWDHKFATAQSLLAKYGLSAPTAARPLLAILHLPRATGWADTENTFWTDWVGSGPGYRKCITVPGWPDQAESGASLAAVANGTNDTHYRTIIRKVVAMFPGETHEYRFMHEANCCYNHRAVNDPASYKQGFDRFYTIAHEEDPGCIVVFCPIYGDGNIAIEAIEPPRLDKYALDYYGSKWDYQTFVTASHGLNFLAGRGQALGVPIGLYEFGPGEWSGANAGQTMPDDPTWVDKLRAFQKAHPIDIVNYIDDTRGSGGVRSDFTVHPQCLTRWVATSVTKAVA